LRKLFAVPETIVEEHWMRIAEEDEIENIQPPVKRRCSCLNDDELHKSVNKLSEEVK